jgi:hypothetical protein
MDLLLTALAPVVWGSTYYAITEWLAGWQPMTLALLRALPAGLLLLRAGWGRPLLGRGLVAAGVVYLVGSGLRLMSPNLSAAFAPAYALPVLAEASFCGWLLWVGMGRGASTGRRRDEPSPD